MIANPPSIADARLVLPVPALQGARSRASRLLLAAALLLATPVAAGAAGTGGVSVSGGSAAAVTAKKASSPRAKSAQAEDETTRIKSVNRTQLKRAQILLRLSPSGTHDPKTRKTVKRFQDLRGLPLTGVVDLATYVQIKNAFALLETGGAAITLAGDDSASGGASTSTPAQAPLVLPANLAPITPQEQAILDAIGQCESQGDPTVISANGVYRGKYQFDKATWKTVGGTGDPAAATEAEQDQRAAILLRQKGTSPWPVCAGSLPVADA